MSGRVKLPKPLVSPDCDCQGLPRMPLDAVALRDSDFAALSTGDEFKAAVMLWCAAWTQVPASSLPNDDRVLARLACCSVSKWRRVREMALRGFVLCADMRLYHPVIADFAVQAYVSRRHQSARAKTRWERVRASMPHGKKASTHGTATVMPERENGKENRSKSLVQEEAFSSEGTSRAEVVPFRAAE